MPSLAAARRDHRARACIGVDGRDRRGSEGGSAGPGCLAARAGLSAALDHRPVLGLACTAARGSHRPSKLPAPPGCPGTTCEALKFNGLVTGSGTRIRHCQGSVTVRQRSGPWQLHSRGIAVAAAWSGFFRARNGAGETHSDRTVRTQGDLFSHCDLPSMTDSRVRHLRDLLADQKRSR